MKRTLNLLRSLILLLLTVCFVSCTEQDPDEEACKKVTTADAGEDQIVSGTTTTLEANTPTVGTGTWSIVSGDGGNLTDASDPSTTFTGTGNSSYTLRWTVEGEGDCSSQDEVMIDLTITNRYSRTYVDGVLSNEFFYDETGRYTGYSSPAYNSTVDLIYSPDGKLIISRNTTNGNIFETKYYYHANGDLNYLVNSEGSINESRTVYTFSNGRVSQLKSVNNSGTEIGKQVIEYLADGYITRNYTDPPNYVNPPTFVITTHFFTTTFADPTELVQSINLYTPWDLMQSYQSSLYPQYDSEFTYEFDSYGRVTKQILYYPNDNGNTVEYTYEYIDN